MSKTSLSYRFLRAIGLNYPEDEYGNVNIIKVFKQFFLCIWRRFLLSMMNWAILEPINPRLFRPFLLRRMGCKVGKNVFIGEYVGVDLNHSNLITIEDGVYVTGRTVLFCHKKDLSNYMIGDDYNKVSYKYAPIVLKKGCSTGTGTLIMPGVTIGEGAIVGAGSLVSKDIPAWTISVGRPAKIVKKIARRVE